VIELRYAGWNGQPEITHPGNKQKLATLFTDIACMIAGERTRLVP
jgi:hypothetical protein